MTEKKTFPNEPILSELRRALREFSLMKYDVGRPSSLSSGIVGYNDYENSERLYVCAVELELKFKPLMDEFGRVCLTREEFTKLRARVCLALRKKIDFETALQMKQERSSLLGGFIVGDEIA